MTSVSIYNFLSGAQISFLGLGKMKLLCKNNLIHKTKLLELFHGEKILHRIERHPQENIYIYIFFTLSCRNLMGCSMWSCLIKSQNFVDTNFVSFCYLIHWFKAISLCSASKDRWQKVIRISRNQGFWAKLRRCWWYFNFHHIYVFMFIYKHINICANI